MEKVPCNLCGSREAKLERLARDHLYPLDSAFRVVKCSHCNLVYLNPRPDMQKMRFHYPQEYQAKIRHVIQKGRQNRLICSGLKMIRRRRMPPVPGGSVLDIGCGRGLYLIALRKMGWKVSGIEIDADSAKCAREQYGLSVRTGPAEEALGEFADKQFDVVTMWHVLEHLFDPSGVLSEVHRILKPGGILMLEVPNFDSFASSLFGKHWFTLEVPRHLYHFTPQTLSAMLAKNGLSLRKLRGVPAPQAIAWSLQILWNWWTRNSRGLSLCVNPVLMTLIFPMDWIMARFRLSSAMSAVAMKPSSVYS